MSGLKFSNNCSVDRYLVLGSSDVNLKSLLDPDDVLSQVFILSARLFDSFHVVNRHVLFDGTALGRSILTSYYPTTESTPQMLWWRTSHLFSSLLLFWGTFSGTPVLQIFIWQSSIDSSLYCCGNYLFYAHFYCSDNYFTSL